MVTYLLKHAGVTGFATAGHVAAPLSGATYQNYRIGFGSNYFNDTGPFLDTSDVVFNPNYVPGVPGSEDEAFLFGEFSNLGISVKTASLYLGSYADLIGENFIISGYGQNGNTDTGFTHTSGNIQAGINRIDRLFPDREGGIIESFLRSPSSLNFNEASVLAGIGSSGGLPYLNIGGVDYGLGVIRGGGGNGFLGVNVINTFDAGVIAPIFESRAAAVPEPSFLAAFFIGGVFFLIRRKHPHRRSAKLECLDGNGIKSLA